MGLFVVFMMCLRSRIVLCIPLVLNVTALECPGACIVL